MLLRNRTLPRTRLPALPITHARRSTTDGEPGFHDGAGFIKLIYDKYNKIKYGEYEDATIELTENPAIGGASPGSGVATPAP